MKIRTLKTATNALVEIREETTASGAVTVRASEIPELILQLLKAHNALTTDVPSTNQTQTH